MFNRINDLIPVAVVEGQVLYQGRDTFELSIDAVQIWRQIRMVFQKLNPFPRRIFKNVAFGAKLNHIQGGLSALVETCLRAAALWGEVKEKLHENAYLLSGGQQKGLCIARALAVSLQMILMDETVSTLDSFATASIEELM